MNQFQIMRERERLKNLQYWLTRAPMSGVLLFGGAFFQMGIALMAVCLIALGFSIYILRTLIQLGKKGWVVTYVLLIGVPFFVCLIPDESGLAVNALLFIPLALFFFYCLILRYSITEWLSDLGDEKAFDLQQKQEKQFDTVWDRLR
jgi:hypothetical protein